MIVLYIILGIVGLVVLFIIWRMLATVRGVRKRDERIIKMIYPIGEKLDAEQEVTIDEVRQLAKNPEVRHMLFTALRELKRPDLIPDDFDSVQDQAESTLVYWMMHPNELQDPPEAMELVKTVSRPFGDREADFYVFRYMMPAQHWAGEDGWLLGLSGPFFGDDEKPYDIMSGAFSRVNDKEGATQPEELVDWYIDMLHKKGAI